MADFNISGVLKIDTTDLDAMTSRVGSTAKKVGGLLAAAFAVDKIRDWGQAGLIAAGQYQQTNVAFSTLIGNAQEAQKFMGNLREFVIKTPFDFPGIADASRKLLGYGFAAKDVIPIMSDIGNTAAALGVSADGVNGFVRALGQMRGKGKVSADEIRQISENFPGFNAAATIAAAKGISVAQTYKLMEKGAIPAEEGITAILKGMRNYPGAAGAMEAQNKTLLGSFSSLKDSIRFAAVDFFTPYLNGIATAMRGLGAVILSRVVPAMGKVSDLIFRSANVMRKTFAPALKDVQHDYALFVSAMVSGSTASGLHGLEAVIAGFGVVVHNVVMGIRTAAKDAAEAWGIFVQGFKTPEIIHGADAIDDRITRLGAFFGVVFRDMSAYFTEWRDNFINGWKHPGLTEGPDAIDDRVSRLAARLKGLLNDIKRQFQLFGMGVRGAVTLDDSKPMYELGKGVTDLGKSIQDHGPVIVKFFKDDMMPVLERIGIFISDNIIPILGGLGGAFAAARLIGPIMAFVGLITTIVSTLGGLGSMAGLVVGAISALISPVGLVVVAIGALVAGVIYAYQHFEGFRVFVGATAAYIKKEFGSLVAFGKEIWPQLSEAVTHVMNVIGDVVQMWLANIKLFWALFGDDILNIVGGTFTIVKSLVENAVNTIANVIRLVLAVINGDWGKAWQAMTNIVQGNVDNTVRIFGGLWEILKGLFGAGYQILKTAALTTFHAITEVLGDIAAGMEKVAGNIVDGLVKGLEKAGHLVHEAMSRLTGGLIGGTEKKLDAHSPSRVFERLGASVSLGFAKGIAGGAGAVDGAMNALTNVPSISTGIAGGGAGAIGGGSGSTVTVGDIIIHGATDPEALRGVIPELTDALRAAVGGR